MNVSGDTPLAKPAPFTENPNLRAAVITVTSLALGLLMAWWFPLQLIINAIIRYFQG